MTTLRRVAQLPGSSWVAVHVALYLTAALIAASLALGGLGWAAVMVVWLWPLTVVAAAGSGICLGLLRFASDLSPLRFRLLAIGFFALPCLVLAALPIDSRIVGLVAATHVVTALLIVRPRL